MIPVKKEYKSEGSLSGDKVEMTIDAAGTAHIIGMLADLYEDSEAAVIRELSCNAWDSHVQAGETRPIEITTPNAMSPNFIVKDYGVGLSVDELSGFYSRVGASTKRDSNEATGMLGIGRLSPLAYSGAFTVSAIKDGVRAIVSVRYNENHIPEVDIVDTKATDEPNGLEVTVPVTGYDLFHRKAQSFFKYWNPDHVLINGKPPYENIRENPNVDDEFYLITRDGFYGNDVIVMGNVAYPVDNLLSKELNRSSNVALYVDIGEFSPVPSRESLHMTPAALEKIDKLREKYMGRLADSAKAEIANAESGTGAVLALHDWGGRIPMRHLEGATYQGQVVPREIAYYELVPDPKPHDKDYKKIVFPDPSKYISCLREGVGIDNKREAFPILEAHTVYIIRPDDLEGITTYRKRQAMKLANDTYPNEHIMTIYVVPQLELPWMDDVKILKWEDVKKVKFTTDAYGQPRKARVKVAGKYDVFDRGLVEIEYDPEEKYAYTTDKKLFGCDIVDYNHNTYRARYLDAVAGWTVIYIGKNRLNKFLRLFPTARDLDGVFEEERKAEYKALDKDLVDAIRYEEATDTDDYSWLQNCDDPELARFGKTKAVYRPEMYRNAVRLVRVYGTKDERFAIRSKSIFHNYPIIDPYNGTVTDIRLEAINALYHYRKENK